MSYEEKIKVIFYNKLEYNGDHEKAIADVKTWLCCEWNCNMIETDEYMSLLNKVDEIAEQIIREL